MKFEILFTAALFVILALCSLSVAEAELKVVSANFEKDIIKQGEGTKLNVNVQNTGDSIVYDISFALGLNLMDIKDIKIEGHQRTKDVGKFREYFIDTKKTSLKPGEIKTIVYVVTAVAPRKEEYEIRFVTGGRRVEDPRLSIEYMWWPTHMDRGELVYLKLELPPEYYFKKAEEYFKSGSYENAKEYAEKAKGIYMDSGNSEMVLNCDNIILPSEKILEAYIVYNRARKGMELGDFRGTISNAELAIEIYNEIASIDSDLVSDKISELKLMIEGINKTVTAWEYFSNATKYFDSKDYEKAKEYAKKAKEIYLEVGNIDSALDCNSLINKCDTYIDRNAIILNVGYGTGGIILILLILLLYRKYRERKYREREF